MAHSELNQIERCLHQWALLHFELNGMSGLYSESSFRHVCKPKQAPGCPELIILAQPEIFKMPSERGTIPTIFLVHLPSLT